MRLLALALLLSACSPAPVQTTAVTRCQPDEIHCHLRYVVWPQAPGPVLAAAILPAQPVLAAIDPTNPDATTDAELINDALAAIESGHWAVLGAVLAFLGWLVFRRNVGGKVGAFLHTHWGTIGGGILAGLLAQVVVSVTAAVVKGTPVTLAVIWAGLLSGAGSIFFTYLRDAMPSAAAQAAKS